MKPWTFSHPLSGPHFPLPYNERVRGGISKSPSGSDSQRPLLEKSRSLQIAVEFCVNEATLPPARHQLVSYSFQSICHCLRGQSSSKSLFSVWHESLLLEVKFPLRLSLGAEKQKGGRAATRASLAWEKFALLG